MKNEFARRLTKYRREQNWTQNDMADFCNLVGRAEEVSFSPNAISGYETGLHVPTGKRAAILCRIIGMRPSTFTNYTGRVIQSKPRNVTYTKTRTRYNSVGGKTITININ